MERANFLTTYRFDNFFKNKYESKKSKTKCHLLWWYRNLNFKSHFPNVIELLMLWFEHIFLSRCW